MTKKRLKAAIADQTRKNTELRRRLLQYDKLGEQISKACRVNEKLKRALVKLASKRRAEQARMAHARLENAMLLELLRNGNQWLAASSLAAEHAAVLSGIKTVALQDRAGISIQKQNGQVEAFSYEEESEKRSKKYGMR